MTTPSKRAKREAPDGQPQVAAMSTDAASMPPAERGHALTNKLPAVTGKLPIMAADAEGDALAAADVARERVPHAGRLEARADAADAESMVGIAGSIDASSLLDADVLGPLSQPSQPSQANPDLRAAPRKPTLAAAHDRASSSPKNELGETPPASAPIVLPPPPVFSAPPATAFASAPGDASGPYELADDLGEEYDGIDDELEDEIEDEADEWSVADQPTVVMSPAAIRRRRPKYLETDRQPAIWPPRPSQPAEGERPRDFGVPDIGTDDRRPSNLNGPRLAAPDGRLAPGTPPEGVSPAALSNPRMHRFQELRRQRLAHALGEHMPDDAPVAEMVRQWWSDLQPALRRALRYQHDAQASGVHPLSPYAEPTPASRLGDAFGRLTATARDLTERATAAAAPHLKRLHDAAEQKAQAVVQKIDGDPIRQQGPLLGPGRIAVFFRPAVTVGQAQRLLSGTQARPLRIIPKRHGFLALVRPGTEADVSERLRQHPYVADVVYLEYDEFGDPIEATGA